MRTAAALFIVLTSVPGTALSQEPRRVDPSAVRSAELRSIRRAVRAEWAAARGTFRPNRDHYLSEVAYRRRGASMEKVLRAQFRPDPDDFVWYEQVNIVRAGSNLYLKSFGDSAHGHAERTALERFVEVLLARLATSPGIEVYSVHCGWGDAVGGASDGLFVYDPATGELLWYAHQEFWQS
jgi:hypothetical protein